MENRKEILSRIRKLRNKQESAEKMGSIEEASAFAAKITELLIKYNVAEHDLNEPEEPGVTRITIRDWASKTDGGFGFTLAGVVAKANLCRVIGRKAGKSFVSEMDILGNPENIETTIFICEFLLTSAKSLSGVAMRNEGYMGNPNTYKRSYYKGFVYAIHRKYENQLTQLSIQNSNLPMLIGNQVAKVDEFINKSYMSLKTAKQNKQSKPIASAWNQGERDGQSISPHKSIS